MNYSKINYVISLVANVGVLAGIIFLAVEIRQNTEMMQAQTRDTMTEKQMDWYMAIGTREFASENFFETARQEGAVLGEGIENASAFTFMVMANIRMWENEWYQYQKGLYEEEEFLTRSSLWPIVVTQPGVIALWNAQKFAYAPDFREYMDNRIAEQQGSN